MLMRVEKEHSYKMIVIKRRVIGFLYGGIFTIMGLFGEGESKLLSIIVTLFGLSMILFWKKKIITIDKEFNRLTISRNSIIKKIEDSYDLDQIVSLELLGKSWPSSHFILNNGNNVYIDGYIGGDADMKKLLKRISDFLAIPIITTL